MKAATPPKHKKGQKQGVKCKFTKHLYEQNLCRILAIFCALHNVSPKHKTSDISVWSEPRQNVSHKGWESKQLKPLSGKQQQNPEQGQ